MSKHSPLPWTVKDAVSRGIVIMFHDPDRDRKRDLDPVVCSMMWFPGYAPDYVKNRIMADAEHIVRACNSHADLLEACKQLWNELEEHRASSLGMTMARDAIEKVKGDQND